MELWRVDVCGVSHRYVEAESREEAKQAVIDALIASFDVRVSKAPSWLARTFRKAGAIQRRNMLAQSTD